MTVFFRITTENKSDALRQMTRCFRVGELDCDRFTVSPEDFRRIPGSPFAYFAGSRVLKLFNDLQPFESSGRTAQQGLASADDFRFVRLAWEVAPEDTSEDQCWVPFAKGGSYSPYYSNVYLRILWRGGGEELKAFSRSVVRNPDSYFRPGLTWTLRTTSSFGIRALPAGCVFGHKGPVVLVEKDDTRELHSLNAILNSKTFAAILALQLAAVDAAARSYEVGVIKRTVLPPISEDSLEELSNLGRRAWETKRQLELHNETSGAFWCVAFADGSKHLEEMAISHADKVRSNEDELSKIKESIDEMSFELFGLEVDDRDQVAILLNANAVPEGSQGVESNDDFKEPTHGTTSTQTRSQVSELLSWLLGCAFGRWDIRCATGERSMQERQNAFDIEPQHCSGMLLNRRGLPLTKEDTQQFGGDCQWTYPLELEWDGILVDDAGHSLDVNARISKAVETVWGGQNAPNGSSSIEREVAEFVNVASLAEYYRNEFFECHIKRYSESRRKAPIYWQLATQSASYSVWLYYHRLTRDTFFKLLRDYVKPKRQYEQNKCDRMRSKAGTEPSRFQRKEIEDQEKLVAELVAMVEEVERIAPLWHPNLNDGVIINFAPLWRLVPQNKSWQKECKKCWDKLVKGEYDWAHLAMHLWPERVVPKCVTDASLAIAHGVEEVFWEQDDRDRFQPKEEPEGGWGPVIKKLVDERTSPAVKAALESLLTAPAPAGNTKSRRRKVTT